MNTDKIDFDVAAATWDKEPGRVKLARDIVEAITREVPLTDDMDALDFGCGTGLLTIGLQPFVRSITGVDSSRGMLDEIEAKISRQKLLNVRTRHLDLDKGGQLSGSYQLVVSGMTLHHVREITPLLKQFHEITAPDGHLCIADLDLEDGKFHGNNEGIFHFGFDRSTLRKAFAASGFGSVRDMTAASIVKPTPEGVMREFTVFLMIGRKKGGQ